MTAEERLRLIVIEELVEAKISSSTAASKLNLSVRHVKRLRKTFKAVGHDSLIHGLRGRIGLRKTDAQLENRIVQIIKERYYDFGPLLVWEKITAVHNITIGRETVRAIMIRNNIWNSKKRKRGEYFCWRDRREAYGELEQFDGSYHDWFEGRNPSLPETCLLAAVDDATGKITKAALGVNESVVAVFTFWKEYIKEKGIPKELYLDKFSTYKINHKKATDNEELMTQFKRAMKTLGTNLIPAHSPQAKGRIERLFGTLQDRLVKEMRLADINTIEEANIFLKRKFIPWFNNRYAVIPKSDQDCHRRLDMSTAHKLDSVFSRHYVRGINNDFTVYYKGKFYQLDEIQPTTVFKTDKVLIEERSDNTVRIKYKNCYLNFFLLPERPKKVRANPVVLTTHKSNYIPPKNHPWRQFRYGNITS